MKRPKLTPRQEIEIRELYLSTINLPRVNRTITTNPERWTYQRLGKRFGVSRETIRRILEEETNHAPD